jgi:hypothetical protein
MKHCFPCRMAAALSLIAGMGATMHAAPPRHAVGAVDIVIDGASQPRYVHDGRSYVEAHKGREYAIRLRNPYGVRVAVALSVDGLNTIDARETTAADARKWVLGPYETVTITGWQTSRTEARRFEFTTEARSYGQALGKTANLGLISAVFFKERAPALTSKDLSRDYAGGRSAAPPSSDARGKSDSAAAAAERKAENEYAATGMGRRTDHAIEQVWLDLEDTPAQTLDIRYEFHPQLVRLGILPPERSVDPLQRRERARGFEPGFCPDPSRPR